MDDICDCVMAVFMHVTKSLKIEVYKFFVVPALSNFPVIIACPFLPESFRWYISKGKFKKGKNAVSKYASHCQVEIPKETIERMVQESAMDKITYI